MFGRFDERYRRWLLARLDRPLSTVVLDVGTGARRLSLGSLLDSAEPRRITVLGGPGSGRTTLLQQTAHRLAQRSRLSSRRSVPVLLDLPTHAGPIIADVPLAEVIAGATDAPARWWAGALHDGRCVLLLDGLDRIVRSEKRTAVARRIAAIDGNHVVVTAERPDEAVAGSVTVRMCPPTIGQAREISPIEVGPEFAGDPLLLTLAARVHRARPWEWPRDPAELYAAALPTDERLDALAFDLMSGRVLDTAAPGLSTVDGVLVGGDGRYRFAQRSFQEYLAARHIHRHGREAVLVQGLGDRWWRRTTLWWATMATVDPVVEAGLGSTDPAVLTLIFRCAEDAAGIGTGLAERLRAYLGGGGRLVASVEADRQLRPVVVTPAGIRMCRDPVSTNLYRLFRDDTGAAAPDGHSEPVPVPPIGDPGALPPVTGVRDGDAERFVRWLNEIAVDTTFRLPAPDERPGARARYTVTWRDLVDAVAADAEPMLNHLLSLGIRARCVVVRRMLEHARDRAGLVVTGFHHRFRARLAARLTVAENRLGDLQRLGPRELGLGIMQVNAERREVAATIAGLREQIGRLGDPHRVDRAADTAEPGWQWAQRVSEVVDDCVTRATGLFGELDAATAMSDVEAAERIDRHLDDLHLRCADLYGRLDPDAVVGAGTRHDARRAERALRQALDDGRRILTKLDALATTVPTVAVEPLGRAIEWQGTPDPYDPARSAAGVLRGALGPAFATGMRRLLAQSRAAPDPVGRCHAFARGLVTAAGLSDGDRVDVRLDECAAAVAAMYARPTRHRLRQRLLRAAGPVFDGSAPAGAADLATIRWYALILAGGRSAAEMRHLAAATVALGRPPDDTLVLVVD